MTETMEMIPSLLEKVERLSLKEQVDKFAVGDDVRVHVTVREGDKERVQIFSGLVIARDGRGASATFTVRRISHGVGVERVFPVHSPNVGKVEVEKSGHVRRAKLYYLRELTGKKAKLREKARR
jgi:large subunit ribosomal protein L19